MPYKNDKANKTGLNLRLRKYVKNLKNRLERRRSKLNPEAAPGYGVYNGHM